jgi:hypothetical protein
MPGVVVTVTVGTQDFEETAEVTVGLSELSSSCSKALNGNC